MHVTEEMANARLVNVEDYRAQRARRCPGSLRLRFGYALDGRPARETAPASTTCGFGRAASPRRRPDVSLELGGHRIDLPVLIAPTGCAGLLWPRGEAQTANAAGNARSIMQSAPARSCRLRTSQPGKRPKWLQLFLYRDRGLTREFMARARAAATRE